MSHCIALYRTINVHIIRHIYAKIAILQRLIHTTFKDTEGPGTETKVNAKNGRKNRRNFVRGSNCPTHSFVSTDGKPHAVKCMDLKGIFRIIQSIPSKKAEPFKQWMAQVAAERINQTIDPERSID